MGFDAAEDGLVSLGLAEGGDKGRISAATEAHLIDRREVLQMFGQFRDRRPQRPRILLTPEDRHAENSYAFDEDLEVGEQTHLVVHELGEFPLDIDQDQDAVFDIHSHGFRIYYFEKNVNHGEWIDLRRRLILGNSMNPENGKETAMPNPEALLLERYARLGDAEAFSEIVRQYAGLVYGTCQRILGDRDLAADAAQETFFQLVKQAGQVRESLLSWLHRVATHKAIDRIRNDSNRRRHEKEYIAGRLHQTDQWQEVAPFVDEAINELDETLRRILTTHFLQGQSMSRIAEAEQVSQATISRRVETALEQLRNTLERRGILVAGVGLGTMLLQSFVEAAPAAVLHELGKMAMVGGSAGLAGSGAAAAASAEAVTVSASAAGSAAGLGLSSKLVAAVVVAALGATGYMVYHNSGRMTPPVTTASSSETDQSVFRSTNPATEASSVSQAQSLSRDDDFENWLKSTPSEKPVTAQDIPAGSVPQAVSETSQRQGGMMAGGAAMGIGGMGMGGAMMGAIGVRFDTPNNTVASFVSLLENGQIEQLSQCFVEGAEDAIQLQQLLQNPKNQGELEFNQCLKSIGSPVDVTRQVEGTKGLEVTWLCTVKKPFTMSEKGQIMPFQPGDRYELDATLVQVGNEWKMSGI
jgi:RNA polymerase sigma factor (sigma-70 family)